jgi:hypothetical protein
MIRKCAVTNKVTASQYAWKLVLMNPEYTDYPPVDQGFSFQEIMPPVLPGGAVAGNFSQVLLILKDLTTGFKVDGVAARCDCTENMVQNVATIAYCTLLALRGYHPPPEVRRGPLRQPSLDDSLLALQCLNADSQCSIDFTRVDQAKLRGVRQHISGSDAAMFAPIADVWIRSYCGGFLSLDDPSHAETLMSLFQNAGINPARIAIAVSIADKVWSECDRSAAIERINGVFIRKFSFQPARFSVRRRRGRPRIYIVVAGATVLNRTPPPASVSSQGINAILLAAKVAAVMASQTSHKVESAHV